VTTTKVGTVLMTDTHVEWLDGGIYGPLPWRPNWRDLVVGADIEEFTYRQGRVIAWSPAAVLVVEESTGIVHTLGTAGSLAVHVK
jgi:hypothetical protein